VTISFLCCAALSPVRTKDFPVCVSLTLFHGITTTFFFLYVIEIFAVMSDLKKDGAVSGLFSHNL
jgi:hypothetical protein